MVRPKEVSEMSHNVRSDKKIVVEEVEEDGAIACSNPRDDFVSSNEDPGRISRLDEFGHISDCEASLLSDVEREMLAEVDEYVESLRREMLCADQNDDSADASEGSDDSNSVITPVQTSTSSAPGLGRSRSAPKSRNVSNEDPELRAYLESCARAQEQLVRAFDCEMDEMTQGLQIGLERIVEDLEKERRRREGVKGQQQEEEGEISMQ